MVRRVAVAGNTPTWRRGVASIMLEAGYEPAEVDSIAEWKPGRHGVAVVLGARSSEVLEEIATFVAVHPHIPLIVVLDRLDLSELAAAIRSGAVAAVGEDEPIDAYRAVVDMALAGRTAMPVDLVRAMAQRIPASPAPEAWVTPQEAGWLRHLASGATVAALASDAGYSEREMFRLLHELYVRIGVKSRTEAIVWATRHGVLDTDETE